MALALSVASVNALLTQKQQHHHHITIINTTPTPLEVAAHFSVSCQHMFGPLSNPSTDTSTFESHVSDNGFSHSISLGCADWYWVKERIPDDEADYDVSFPPLIA